MKPMAVIVTCEHASNHVPPRYRTLFAGHAKLLESHRAYDKGARELARGLAKALGAEAAFGPVSRLLVDLNRSPANPALLSRFSKGLSHDEKAALIEGYYRPFRDGVERRVAWHLAAGRAVLHLSVHSFAPVLRGKRRGADVGLLYDPARELELELALAVQRALKARGLVVRRNYPYRGVADGHTTALRRTFVEGYVGLELELNQRLAADASRFARVRRDIAEMLREIVKA